MKYKKCNTCGEVKPISNFYKRNKHSKYRDGICSKCKGKYNRDCKRTEIGVLRAVYMQQVSSSRKRGHNPPAYSREEFIDMFLHDESFLSSFQEWKNKEYSRAFAPSFDRKDNNKGYSFDNFNGWMAWKDNRAKAHEDMRNGLLIPTFKPHKPVDQYTKGMQYIASFPSASQAARMVKTAHQTGISECCRGIRRSSGGFVWVFSKTDAIREA